MEARLFRRWTLSPTSQANPAWICGRLSPIPRRSCIAGRKRLPLSSWKRRSRAGVWALCSGHPHTRSPSRKRHKTKPEPRSGGAITNPWQSANGMATGMHLRVSERLLLRRNRSVPAASSRTKRVSAERQACNSTISSHDVSGGICNPLFRASGEIMSPGRTRDGSRPDRRKNWNEK